MSREAKIITFINEKGGLGKSSLIFNTAWELANQKKKVLMVDLDGQEANITYIAGVKKEKDIKTIFNVLLTDDEIADAIVSVKENLDIVPAKSEVSSLPESAKPGRLRRQLKTIEDRYDYIFLDVSPTPNRSHGLALCVSEYVVIPMLPDALSLKGLAGVKESIKEIQDVGNPELKVLGVIFNKYHKMESNLSKESQRITAITAKELNTTVFNTKIKEAVVLGENVIRHEGITNYAPNHEVAYQYKEFIKEMEDRING